MTADQFNFECSSRLINPNIAIVDPAIREALRIRDDKKVIEILILEF